MTQSSHSSPQRTAITADIASSSSTTLLNRSSGDEEAMYEQDNASGDNASKITTVVSDYGSTEWNEIDGPSVETGAFETRFSLYKLLRFSGPGFAMSIAYVDPENVCSDLHCGAVAGYKLLWLLFLTHVLGLFIQVLSARIGIVTGKHLAQHCRRTFRKSARMPLWLVCELAIIGSDIQEAIGTAVALHLLFGLQLWVGILLAAVFSYAILGIQRFGVRKVEAIFICMIAVMCGCFGVEALMAKPSLRKIVEGMVVPRIPRNATTQAVGIIGAVIMPHNLFLHSALVGTRKIERRAGVRGDSVREANYYNTVESAIALFFSFIINATILVVFADIYHFDGDSGEKRLPGLIEAADLLRNAFGYLGPLLWAIGLLSSGQSSTATGTLAGQYLMEGMMDLRVSAWLRLLITRSISLIPTMLVGTLAASHIDQFDEWLNVLQSLALSFALIPTLKLAQSSIVMGDEFATRWRWRVLGWVAAACIIALNVYLMLPLVTEFASQSSAAWGAVAYAMVASYLAFIGFVISVDC